MIKSFAILKKKDDLTQDEFLRYWKEKHGPLAAEVIPGLRKYIQCHPIRVSGIEFEIDGIAELWWDSLESYQSYSQTWRPSEEGKVLREDEEKFIDTSRLVRFLAEEQFIVEDQA
jgi:uncharacterized protein (TIGR02118 family)